MSDFQSAWRQLNASTMLTVRELALSADLAAWVGDNDRCMAIIARIYDAFDDLDDGLAPHACALTLAAGAAAWVAGRSAEPAGVLVSFGHLNEMVTSEVARR